ncbi:MAG: hypothetical protein C0482_16755 [Gordonia sp.]|nr:hypothetical protein [Gordonia sp. (in: high G+C Gram-positive bacteria)]
MTMQPLNCDSCGLAVTVEKFSDAHTSIQWLADATACPFAAARGHVLAGDRSCPELRRSIDVAVRENTLSESRIELPTGAAIPRMARGAGC